MELEGSLPYSQVSATCPYHDPDRLSHTPASHFPKTHLNIVLSSTPWSSKWSLSSGFSTKTLLTPLLAPIHATCSAHLILLDSITRRMLGEEYRLLSSSLCSFSQLPWDVVPLRAFTYSLKVNFTLEEAMKAQRWSRGISLLFL